jgi:hypothetical protein
MYHMNLKEFSLEQFKGILQTGHLLPSERILAEDIQHRFEIVASMGITDLQTLVETLSTKKKLETFAQKSGLPLDYLTVLRRRANTYTPRPVALDSFPGIAPEYLQCLAALGIKDTKQLFDRAWTIQGRAELAKIAAIPEPALLELVKLSDLARAPYVGGVFARLFYEAGADTLAKLAGSPPDTLCERLRAVNEQYHFTKAGIPSVSDMTASLEIYKLIPPVVEYS